MSKAGENDEDISCLRFNFNPSDLMSRPVRTFVTVSAAPKRKIAVPEEIDQKGVLPVSRFDSVFRSLDVRRKKHLIVGPHRRMLSREEMPVLGYHPLLSGSEIGRPSEWISYPGKSVSCGGCHSFR